MARVATVGVLALAACSPPPPELGEVRGTLTPCLRTACVHTGMRHPEGVRGIHVTGRMTQPQILGAVLKVVEGLPGVEIVAQSERYLRAEIDYLIPGRIDDLEVLVSIDREVVVRSAARGPLTDFGANRRRVEAIRAGLVEAGVLQ